MCSFISSTVICGLSIFAQIPSITSPKLCEGMLVAIPTAMPVPPFTNKLGMDAGRTSGSTELPSYVSW